MTALMDTIGDSLVAGYRDSLHLHRFGADGALITLPHTLQDGTPVQVLVEREGKLVTVTDRGLVADHLDMFGVDLDRTTVAGSWAAIRAGITFSPAIGSDDWDISAMGGQGEMAALVQAVADAAVRADGLRVLASGHTPKSFAGRVVAAIGERVAVVPRAALPDRFGAQRQVTCSVGVSNVRYVQALSSGSKARRVQNFDKARSMFSSSTAPEKHRVSLLEGSASTWDRWQMDGLREVGVVAFDHDIDRFIVGVLADDA